MSDGIVVSPPPLLLELRGSYRLALALHPRSCRHEQFYHLCADRLNDRRANRIAYLLVKMLDVFPLPVAELLLLRRRLLLLLVVFHCARRHLKALREAHQSRTFPRGEESRHVPLPKFASSSAGTYDVLEDVFCGVVGQVVMRARQRRCL